MPYLNEEKKKTLDVDNDVLIEYLTKETAQDLAGDLNYLNFIIIRRWIKRNGQKYWVFALFVGTLICCVLEIYRRLVTPYEDKKIAENGDVE